jgi:hypothetical protein
MSWFDGETVKTAGGDGGDPGLRIDRDRGLPLTVEAPGDDPTAFEGETVIEARDSGNPGLRADRNRGLPARQSLRRELA